MPQKNEELNQSKNLSMKRRRPSSNYMKPNLAPMIIPVITSRNSVTSNTSRTTQTLNGSKLPKSMLRKNSGNRSHTQRRIPLTRDMFVTQNETTFQKSINTSAAYIDAKAAAEKIINKSLTYKSSKNIIKKNSVKEPMIT